MNNKKIIIAASLALFASIGVRGIVSSLEPDPETTARIVEAVDKLVEEPNLAGKSCFGVAFTQLVKDGFTDRDAVDLARTAGKN